jgi:hypothetical protein
MAVSAGVSMCNRRQPVISIIRKQSKWRINNENEKRNGEINNKISCDGGINGNINRRNNEIMASNVSK